MLLFDLHPKETPEFLYGRKEDLQKLTDHIRHGRWVTLLGPRMVGKTSLVKATQYKLQKERFTVLYVCLWGTNSLRGFLDRILSSIRDSEKLFRKVKSQLAKIDKIEVGPLNITVKNNLRQPVPLTSQVLELLGNQSKKTVIILDEVQELSYVSSHLHRILANIFTTHSKITFCFTGSQTGLLKSLQSPGPDSPLYGRSPATIVLEPFDNATAKSFLFAGFKECGINTTDDVIAEVVERFGGIPGWLSYYGNSVAISKLSHDKAMRLSESDAFKIVNQTLEHYLEGRTRNNHLLVLRAIAMGHTWSEIRRAVSERTGKKLNEGSLQNIIQSLISGYLVKREGPPKDSIYHIIDPVMRRYLLSRRVKITG